jgi:hypothetical protein
MTERDRKIEFLKKKWMIPREEAERLLEAQDHE